MRVPGVWGADAPRPPRRSQGPHSRECSIMWRSWQRGRSIHLPLGIWVVGGLVREEGTGSGPSQGEEMERNL